MSNSGSFHYRDGELFCEEVPLRRIAEEEGTPLFIYSQAHIKNAVEEYRNAFRDIPHLLNYAVKANSNIAVLRLLASLGCGAEIISGGELYRARRAGIEPEMIIFDGPGKSAREMLDALKEGILMFNVESEQELESLNGLASRMKVRAPVALRINPDVNPRTHPSIATGLKKYKFGIPIDDALRCYRQAAEMSNLEVVGIHQHIGSQITTVRPFKDSVGKLVRLVKELRSSGVNIDYLDIGGGPGIRYDKERVFTAESLMKSLRPLIDKAECRLILEPGRSIVGNSGVMVTRLLYTKQGPAKKFYIVDAAMNDLIRPSLYDAYHQINPLEAPPRRGNTEIVDLVGPICESGDYFARDREMPLQEPGSLLAVMSAGAYGFTMASNYNTRPRAAEVLVAGNEYHLIRRRETYKDLIRGEKIPEYLQ